MSQTDVASPAHITAIETLAYFSELFYGAEPPTSIASVFVAVDDWWYVPRNKKTFHASLARARKAFLKYTMHGVVPLYVINAHGWSMSHHFGKAQHSEDIAKNIE